MLVIRDRDYLLTGHGNFYFYFSLALFREPEFFLYYSLVIILIN